jgi:glycosyltransferase involved in cell wall biosynthesis
VVPAWNEAESIPHLLRSIHDQLPDVDVVVVDDGSTDGTAAVVRALGAPIIELPFNVGVGGAMRAGFLYAYRHGYGAVVQVDADGQHDPADVPRLLGELHRGADVVIGSRFAGSGDYDVRGPRRWAMGLLARSVSRLVGVHLTDVTSGFRASSASAVALFAREYPPEYLGDTVESLVLAGRAGLKLSQVPVAMRPRLRGRPSQSPVRASVYLARAALVLTLAVLHSAPEAAGE